MKKLLMLALLAFAFLYLSPMADAYSGAGPTKTHHKHQKHHSHHHRHHHSKA